MSCLNCDMCDLNEDGFEDKDTFLRSPSGLWIHNIGSVSPSDVLYFSWCRRRCHSLSLQTV